MADPLSHATQGALMLLAPFISRVRQESRLWMITACGGLLGLLPDLFYVCDYVGGSGNTLYLSAHHGAIRNVLQYVPMCALHFVVDSLTHDAGRQWYGWNVRIWLQLLLWVVNVALIVWFVRIFRRKKLAG
jgi:hypothetical protein